MRILRPFFAALLLGAMGAGTAAAGPSIPAPDYVLAVGATLGANSNPSGGGASAALSVLWPIEPRIRVGVQGYADDIGTDLVQLRDPNDGTPLGPAADLHRWTWGAAWRVEADTWTHGKWASGVSGAWGWWRVEDDRRGDLVHAASAVGLRVGADLRRDLGHGRALGIEANFHRLAHDPHADWRRVERYATVALQLRWAAADLHD